MDNGNFMLHKGGRERPINIVFDAKRSVGVWTSRTGLCSWVLIRSDTHHSI